MLFFMRELNFELLAGGRTFLLTIYFIDSLCYAANFVQCHQRNGRESWPIIPMNGISKLDIDPIQTTLRKLLVTIAENLSARTSDLCYYGSGDAVGPGVG